MSQHIDRPYAARLIVRRAEDGLPSVQLDGHEISGLLTPDGLRIHSMQNEMLGASFEVTLTFGAGFLDLDFDAHLLEELRERAARKAAGQ